MTDQIVDLDSRIASGQASVARLRDLLGRSGDVTQLAAVEGELARREADLESLLGQRRVLEDRVDLSTITADLRQVGDDRDRDGADDGLPGFLAGLGSGWRVAIAGGTVALAAIGFALPFVPVVAVAVVGYRVVSSSWRRTA